MADRTASTDKSEEITSLSTYVLLALSRLSVTACSVVSTVDVRNAGDGTLEISICGPSGQNVSNNVAAQGPGMFLVNFVPVECGQHRANVTFNKENIRGL